MEGDEVRGANTGGIQLKKSVQGKKIKIVNETGIGNDTKVYTENGECLNDYGLIRIFIHPIDSDSLIHFTLTFDYDVQLHLHGKVFKEIITREGFLKTKNITEEGEEGNSDGNLSNR